MVFKKDFINHSEHAVGKNPIIHNITISTFQSYEDYKKMKNKKPRSLWASVKAQ